MKIVSRYPIVDDWVLMFAITDGRFCGFEGLSRLLSSFSSFVRSRIEFAVLINSIYTKTLHIHIHDQINQKLPIYRFIQSLSDSLKMVGIRSEMQSKNPFTQEVFDFESIDSISITGGAFATSVTDCNPDVLRADSFAWALSESILRTVYKSKPDVVLIAQKLVDTSARARVFGKVPRIRKSSCTVDGKVFYCKS